MSELFGQVNQTDPEQELVMLQVKAHDIYTLNKYHQQGKPQVVSIIADDQNSVSPQQRRLAFGLMMDIWQAQVGGEWLETPTTVKRHFYATYEYYNGLDFGEFSLSQSKGNKTDANQFINLLLDYAAQHKIALSLKPINELVPEAIAYWEYRALLEGIDVIDGSQPVELAHGEHTVGMGRNRDQISNIGNTVFSLSHAHHMELHQIGLESFKAKYHLNGVKVTADILEKLYKQGKRFGAQNGY
jgi:hypothetical protein